MQPCAARKGMILRLPADNSGYAGNAKGNRFKSLELFP
jgi:hypothetical protein